MRADMHDGMLASCRDSPYNLLDAGQSALCQFEDQGIIPVGRAAFAFATSVTAGLLLRRTMPAMATGLAVFSGIRVAARQSAQFASLLDPGRRSSPLLPTCSRSQSALHSPAGRTLG